MKKSIVLPGAIILVLNIVLGLILSKYELYNVCVSSVVIALTVVMLNLLYSTNLRSAFRISLISLFIFNGIVSIILSILSPSTFTDNGYLIAIIALFAIEAVVWVICNSISKSVKQ